MKKEPTSVFGNVMTFSRSKTTSRLVLFELSFSFSFLIATFSARWMLCALFSSAVIVIFSFLFTFIFPYFSQRSVFDTWKAMLRLVLNKYWYYEGLTYEMPSVKHFSLYRSYIFSMFKSTSSNFLLVFAWL